MPKKNAKGGIFCGMCGRDEAAIERMKLKAEKATLPAARPDWWVYGYAAAWYLGLAFLGIWALYAQVERLVYP